MWLREKQTIKTIKMSRSQLYNKLRVHLKDSTDLGRRRRSNTMNL